MTHRIAAMAAAAVLLAAGGASAQIADVGGTVVYIDAAAKTITFSDGRIAHYDPWWRILVNGREVAVTEAPPGAVIAVAPSGIAPVTAVVPGAPQPAMAQVHPSSTMATSSLPVEGRGTVARIDEATKTLTLQDGRVLKMSEVQVWRQETLEGLQPGAQVYVSNMPHAPVTAGGATRTTVVPGTTTVVAPGTTTTVVPGTTTIVTPGRTATEVTRGRVTSVRPQGSHIVLSDGRTVFVSPSGTVQGLKAKTVTVSELRPGDEVVVQVQQVIPIAGAEPVTTTGPAHAVVVAPSYTFPGSAKIAADRVIIVRYPQGL